MLKITGFIIQQLSGIYCVLCANNIILVTHYSITQYGFNAVTKNLLYTYQSFSICLQMDILLCVNGEIVTEVSASSEEDGPSHSRFSKIQV